MKMNTRLRGKLAEDLAAEYLINKGFEIVARNYQIWGGEIDIIARLEEQLVFVEVKSIQSENGISIYETLSSSKVRQLSHTINYWLMENKQQQADFRLDFVGIVLNSEQKLEHLEHIPYVEIN